MTVSVPHLLIYDADLSGHHRDYLDAVVNYVGMHSKLSNDDDALRISFMLPVGYWDLRSEATTPRPINRLDIPEQTLAVRNSLTRRQQALFEVELLADIVDRHGVDELILMNLDYFQVALASPKARQLNCVVSGIQLQPYTRSELVARQPPISPMLWFRTWRKRFRLQRMIKNVSMGRLCVPADRAAVSLLNKRHASQVQSTMLPEPYLGTETVSTKIAADDLPDIHNRYSLPSSSRIVLIFGHIIARKNVENVIRAMNILHSSGCNNVALLVVGKASSSYQKTLRNCASKSPHTKSSVHFDFEFVSDTVLEALFRACDVVAMPYFKAYQSSGVLFQAVQYQKPVITANRGLITELLLQYELGKSVDPTSPQQISDAIEQLLEAWEPSPAVQELFNCHTPENHAAVLLNQTLPV